MWRRNASESSVTAEPTGRAPVPTYLITDYIEIAYLPTAIFVGVSLNALAFRRMWRQWRRKDCLRMQRRDHLLLKLNLSVADFMVLLIYGLGRFCWIGTYQWLGGQILCQAYQFISLAAFHMMAFVMVAIALDRVRAVYAVAPIRNCRKMRSKFIRNTLIAGWLLALLASSGQWCVWRLYSPPFQADFLQCTTIWEIAKVRNNTLDMNAFRQGSGMGETAYTTVHLLSAFWIPLLVIGICYALICIRYFNHMLRLSVYQPQHQRTFGRMSFLGSTSGCPTSGTVAGFGVGVGVGAAEPPPPPTPNRSYFTKKRPSQWRNSRQSSVRSTTTLSEPAGRKRAESLVVATRRFRTRVFRTSGLIILCYVTCWLPYNVLSLWKLVSPHSYVVLSEELNILNALIVLNSVFNPIINGFR